MIWDYVQENSDVAVNQMKRLGASADWSRFKFMLEPEIVDLVLSTFEQLHNDGLIYRAERLVNYSPKAGTSYSQLEIEYVERISPLYYIRYPLVDNPDEYAVVATVRPEPIFADTHLAVHPDNPKTQHLIGRQVRNPLTDAVMNIITDEFVDPEFGTGVVKLTPAHDHNDFEVAQKHGLPINQAITIEGRISELGGKYAGMKVNPAREAVVKDLTDKGLIEKVDQNYTNRVATCYKTGGNIEPLPLSQFFINVQPLAKKALAALNYGQTTIHGAGREKILRHWLKNLKDWNISRQIVWGIRIPVWYDLATPVNQSIVLGFLDEHKKFIRGTWSELKSQGYSLEQITTGLQTLMAPKTAEYTVSRTSPGGSFIQETDTFDTWFSSGQWVSNTLKTNQPTDFDKFYPTTIMETGYDILTFWIMRMMLLDTYRTGQSPFQQVYLHGLFRDEKGLKMSKSKGNVINPLDVADKYGADAVRIALVMGSTPGQDSSVGESKIKGMRNFSNKIWNAARFVHLLKEQQQPSSLSAVERPDSFLKSLDAEFTATLNQTITDITRNLQNYKPGLAAEIAHNQFWHWYCDEMIEAAKNDQLSINLLESGLQTFLTLLHPFMPFVTEAVWQELNFDGLLITQTWPKTSE